MARRLRSLLIVLVAAFGGGVRAEGWQTALKGTARLLVDSNAPRDYASGPEAPSTLDLALSVLGAAEARRTGERTQLLGRYELGARKYSAFPGEDTLIQSGAVEGSLALGTEWGVGVEGHAKDRRGGSRAYSDLGASLFAEYAPDVRLALRLNLGPRRFVYRANPSANFGGLEVGGLARYRFNRRHSLNVFGGWGSRGYGTQARLPGDAVPETYTRRHDGAIQVGAGYAYRGPVALGLTYTYQETDSNSFGETMLRHRVTANAGVRLPWRLSLFVQGSLGLSRYPDGIYLSPEIILVEEDEGQDSLSLKLTRPVSEHVDLEVSWGLWSTRLPHNGLSYSRQLMGVGITWRDAP
ncbi:hypothetical protein JGU66_10360 [Myxococcaceae bacterium JPH2]|nr:hypothetical protein [Myxococcaceae bacterium JPH2]